MFTFSGVLSTLIRGSFLQEQFFNYRYLRKWTKKRRMKWEPIGFICTGIHIYRLNTALNILCCLLYSCPLVLNKYLNHYFLLVNKTIVHGVIPTQLEDFALPFVEFQEISLDPALQPIQFPLNGSTTLWFISCSSQYSLRNFTLFIKTCSVRSEGKTSPVHYPEEGMISDWDQQDPASLNFSVFYLHWVMRHRFALKY